MLSSELQELRAFHQTVAYCTALFISFPLLDHHGTPSLCCTVGLPVTVVFSSIVSGLVTALVMSCAGKRKKWKRRLEGAKNEIPEKGPVYDAPRRVTGTNEGMALRENVCYAKTSVASSKLDQDFI